jgi:hypothetical protein
MTISAETAINVACKKNEARRLRNASSHTRTVSQEESEAPTPLPPASRLLQGESTVTTRGKGVGANKNNATNGDDLQERIWADTALKRTRPAFPRRHTVAEDNTVLVSYAEINTQICRDAENSCKSVRK